MLLLFLANPARPAATSGSASSNWLEKFRKTLQIWMTPSKPPEAGANAGMDSEIIAAFGSMPNGESQTVLGEEDSAYQVLGPWATWHAWGETTSSDWQLEVFARPEEVGPLLRLLPDLRNAWISHSVAVHGPTFRQRSESGGGSAKFLVLHPGNSEQRSQATRLLSSWLRQHPEISSTALSEPQKPGLDLTGGAHRVYAVTGIAYDPNRWAYDGGIDCRTEGPPLCRAMAGLIRSRRDEVAELRLDFALAPPRDRARSRRPASSDRDEIPAKFGMTTAAIDGLEEFSNNVIQLGLTRDGKADPSLRCKVLETSGDIPFAACDAGQNLSVSTASAAEGQGEVKLEVSDGESTQQLVFKITVKPRGDRPPAEAR